MIWTALLLGFFGSFHCLGMCGPIAMAVAAADTKRYWPRKLYYNLGRTITYSLLGLLIGTMGWGLQLAGIQQWMSIALGVMIILFAMMYKKGEQAIVKGGLYQLVGRIKSGLSFWLGKGGTWAFFMTGLVNGLLPCGMVYIALLASLALSSPLEGALYMFAFGTGTVPLLFVLMLGGQLFSLSTRQRVFKLMPYVAVFIGLLFIVRGLGLGIHFLSPELSSLVPSIAPTEITICK
ncbi:sulfite exporter TauE/SafE family protein [Echinicola sp. CAU 1574]|uniref:Sulfite exporter TauE/SafE family protein n=1 Tax=Echinicola arenosa TaxID=2774144 RepID=A0ABR9AET1_9BACT|nr:sulfite exporter TauE/SafE family protein [Echinicola arenosa]MBD8487138.1 sulfite exporter TauE/SafE family protein [Echinicola arenosa]